jgi:hypothetical protein
MIDSKSLFSRDYSDKCLLIMIILLINSIPIAVSSNCPLLHSFMNDTGILMVNKTAMIGMESTIHCQWLVVGSIRQVRS